jgi:cell division protease FtsH
LNAKFLRNGIVMLVLVVGTVALLAAVLISPNGNGNAKPYSVFLSEVAAGQIQSVTQQDQTLTVNKNTPGAYTVIVPTVLTQVWTDVSAAAQSGGKPAPSFEAVKAPDNSWLGLVLTAVLPIVVIVGFIIFMMRQAQGTNNQALSFGKSRARMFLGN